MAGEEKQLLRLALGTGDAGYAGMLVLVLCATALAGLIVWFAPLESVSAIYMLPVLVAAIRYGTGPAIAAALLGAVMTSLFYPPLFSVLVFRPAQLIDLVTSLVVALTLGWLAGHLRTEMVKVREEERRIRQLYRLSGEIAGAVDVAAIYGIVAAHMADLFGREVALFVAADGRSWRAIRAPAAGAPLDELTRAVESFATRPGDAAGPEVELLALGPQAHWLLCDLSGPDRPRAVLAVRFGGDDMRDRHGRRPGPLDPRRRREIAGAARPHPRSGRAASSNAGGLIRWPVILLLPVGFSLILLQDLSEMIKRAAALRGFHQHEYAYEKPLQ